MNSFSFYLCQGSHWIIEWNLAWDEETLSNLFQEFRQFSVEVFKSDGLANTGEERGSAGLDISIDISEGGIALL